MTGRPRHGRAIRPGDHVGCGELPLLGRVERLEAAAGPFPARAYVMRLRTVWRGFGDGVGGYLAWWPLRALRAVDIDDFEYCPTRDRYYPRRAYRPVPPAVPRLRLDAELGPELRWSSTGVWPLTEADVWPAIGGGEDGL